MTQKKTNTDLSKAEWRELFRHAIVTFVFTKVDGFTQRKLVGTLHPSFLPPFDETDGISDSRENEKILAVWDIENDGWRAFRLDSVVDVLSIDVLPPV